MCVIVHATACVWRSRDNFAECSLFPRSVGSRDQKSGHQAGEASAVTTEPCCWPFFGVTLGSFLF